MQLRGGMAEKVLQQKQEKLKVREGSLAFRNIRHKIDPIGRTSDAPEAFK